MSDIRSTTYFDMSDLPCEFNFTYFNIPSDEFFSENSLIIKELSMLVCEHNFNMLGSGWVKVYPGMKAQGLEGYKYSFEERIFDRNKWLQSHLSANNFKKSQEKNDLIDTSFKPIDWQVDFKSGYRWDENIWHKDIQYGHIPGADIKVPWELGRMQYLPYLAHASACSLRGYEGFLNPSDYYKEFKNQILCFISSNPPRFGVQWMTAMDASLRAVSWLATYDMFCGMGFSEDKIFKKELLSSLYDHLKYIADYLEWSGGMRGNHYFFNICGLLFLSAYLTTTELTTTTLAFSLQEFINELNYQFLDDGGNFEASLPYHLFVYEAVLWCLYIISKLPEEKTLSLVDYNPKKWIGKRQLLPAEKQKFEVDLQTKRIILPKETIERLNSIAHFTDSIIIDGSNTAQIGDNDGGVFLKLHIPYMFCERKYLSEFLNLKQNNPANESGKFISENLTDKGYLVELSKIFKGTSISKYSNLSSLVLPTENNNFLIKNKDKKQLRTTSQLQVELSEFPDFGLYVYDSHYYKAFVRCGNIGQKGKGGHSHNDQLSISLYCGSKPVFVDPGTYLYTPIYEKRNLFRSVNMHNTLNYNNIEPNPWNNTDKDDLFWIAKDRAKAKAIQTGNNFFTGEHRGFGEIYTRKIEFHLNHISGEDTLEMKGARTLVFRLHPSFEAELDDKNNKVIIKNSSTIIELSFLSSIPRIDNYLYSESYGYIQNAKVIKADTEKNVIKWNIEIISI